MKLPYSNKSESINQSINRSPFPVSAGQVVSRETDFPRLRRAIFSGWRCVVADIQSGKALTSRETRSRRFLGLALAGFEVKEA